MLTKVKRENRLHGMTGYNSFAYHHKQDNTVRTGNERYVILGMVCERI